MSEPIGRMLMLRAMRDTEVYDGDTDASMDEVGITPSEAKAVALSAAVHIVEHTASADVAAMAAFIGAFELGVRCARLADGVGPHERVCPRCQVGWRTHEPPLRCSFCNRPTLPGRLAGAPRSL